MLLAKDMSYMDKVEDIIDRYEDGKETLDDEQLFGMLKIALEGLNDCDREGAAKAMYEMAGYSLR